MPLKHLMGVRFPHGAKNFIKNLLRFDLIIFTDIDILELLF